MCTTTVFVGLACGLLAVACDSSQNVPANLTAPSSTPSASPTFVSDGAISYPQVTMTLTGGDGPTGCRTGPQIGQIDTSPLGFTASPTVSPVASLPEPVAPSPAPILVILDPHNWPTDQLADYTGTLSGSTINAVGRYYGGSGYCGGNTYVGNINYGVPATFSGTVSADGTLLTGHEVRTSMLGSTTYSYNYDWRATLK